MKALQYMCDVLLGCAVASLLFTSIIGIVQDWKAIREAKEDKQSKR